MKFRLAVGATLVLVLMASAASGDDKKKAPAGPPDEKAMMEAMTRAATPGEPHKKLDVMVGTFDTKVKMWMDPSKPPPRSRPARRRTAGYSGTGTCSRPKRGRSWGSPFRVWEIGMA